MGDLPLAGKSILIVEDCRDTRILLMRIIESAGAEVSVAVNGDQALRLASKEDFDVILMDVHMPVKDGCAVAAELRRLKHHGLIIALTANAMEEERERCLKSGFNAHFTKPMRKMDLIENIRCLCGLGSDKNVPDAKRIYT